MHQTPVFSYALAGGVAGIVLILLIVLCIALFDKDRKRKMKQRKFLDSMNLPPPPTELRNGRSSSKRKSSVRFSATPSVGDQIRSPTKMKSFSLKKTDQPDANSV
ncbi:uncharacterized protein [Argopecten irradians]|uniref:uncharacterized protein n=1 Tax=Argopecten irradians TaxID=31199 RepID=UPI00371A1227